MSVELEVKMPDGITLCGETEKESLEHITGITILHMLSNLHK
jgi:hypothetical protein